MPCVSCVLGVSIARDCLVASTAADESLFVSTTRAKAHLWAIQVPTLGDGSRRASRPFLRELNLRNAASVSKPCDSSSPPRLSRRRRRSWSTARRPRRSARRRCARRPSLWLARAWTTSTSPVSGRRLPRRSVVCVSWMEPTGGRAPTPRRVRATSSSRAQLRRPRCRRMCRPFSRPKTLPTSRSRQSSSP